MILKILKQMKQIKLSKILLEEEQALTFNLQNLQFAEVERAFPEIRQGERIAFPYASDELSSVDGEQSFERWKKEILNDFGDVKVILHPESNIWYKKVEISDSSFSQEKETELEKKGRYMQDYQDRS